MGWISPRQLNDDPKLWLSVPHELHESLGKFQERLFPGFQQKLRESHVHCLECEGEKPFEVLDRATLEPGLCTGYIGELGQVELLRITKEGG